jgi:hypothetical protein
VPCDPRRLGGGELRSFLDAFAPQDESTLNRLLEAQLPPELEATCADLDRLIGEHALGLKNVAVSVDPTLAGAVDTTIDRMRDTIKTLQSKILQAAKKKDDASSFARARSFERPAAGRLPAAFFLNRYGPRDCSKRCRVA